MSASGVMLSQITIHETVEVVSMVWACEKFYLSEQDANNSTSGTTTSKSSTNTLPHPQTHYMNNDLTHIHNMNTMSDDCYKCYHSSAYFVWVFYQ